MLRDLRLVGRPQPQLRRALEAQLCEHPRPQPAPDSECCVHLPPSSTFAHPGRRPCPGLPPRASRSPPWPYGICRVALTVPPPSLPGRSAPVPRSQNNGLRDNPLEWEDAPRTHPTPVAAVPSASSSALSPSIGTAPHPRAPAESGVGRTEGKHRPKEAFQAGTVAPTRARSRALAQNGGKSGSRRRYCHRLSRWAPVHPHIHHVARGHKAARETSKTSPTFRAVHFHLQNPARAQIRPFIPVGLCPPPC